MFFVSEYEVELEELEVKKIHLADMITGRDSPDKLLKAHEVIQKVIKDVAGYQEVLRRVYTYGRDVYIVARDGGVLQFSSYFSTIRKVEFLKALEEYWPFVKGSYEPYRHMWVIGDKAYEVESIEDLKKVLQELARLADQISAGARERAHSIISEKLTQLDGVVLDTLKYLLDDRLESYVYPSVRGEVARLIERSVGADVLRAYLDYVKSKVNIDVGKLLRDAIAMFLVDAEEDALPRFFNGLKKVEETLREYNVNLLEVLKEANKERPNVNFAAMAIKAGIEVEKWSTARGPRLSI